ncbi:unnamed protein product [Pedinophyceae sp. YPF-701]|nr:unnamed protein product [Pedinophyceae sp. YPF-701]
MGGGWRATGPLSYQGVENKRAQAWDEAAEVPLVVRRDPTGRFGGPALVHPADAAALGLPEEGGHVVRAPGSDAVVLVRPDPTVEPGTICIDQASARNLHIAEGDTKNFKQFDLASISDAHGGHGSIHLVELSLEVRGRLHRDDASDHTDAAYDAADHGAMDASDSDDEDPADARKAREAPSAVDADAVARAFCAQQLGRVVSANMLTVVDVAGCGALVVRVARTDTMDAAEQEEAAFTYHCFRGVLSPDTRVDVGVFEGCGVDVRGGVDPAERAAGAQAAARRGEIVVQTTDGEGGRGDPFVVRRKLLRPCIRLTGVVRGESAGEERDEVAVNVDTLTFDRVLIFLEALHAGRDPPDYGVHYLDDLMAAAEELGLRPLAEYVSDKRGHMQARIREWALDEIFAANNAGGCLLLVDGMVLDVQRWLPEHPGGSTIIPKQALNVDSTVFFELYHASRESFLYLREFYVGELRAADLSEVPPPRQGEGSAHEPSQHFLEQLAAFTPWRMGSGAAARKAKLHLGA